MKIKTLHYFSGSIIFLFTGIHLFNHLYGISGISGHIEMMKALRPFYRNPFSETILLLAVVVQIFSGLKLFFRLRKQNATGFDRLKILSGLYLSFFLIFHVSAVMAGRFYLHLDTNFYFGAAGINVFPFNLFFIPYYALAMLSFFGHIAAIHHTKMKKDVLGLSSSQQAKGILILGFGITFFIFFGLTNHFRRIQIPAEYQVMIGK